VQPILFLKDHSLLIYGSTLTAKNQIPFNEEVISNLSTPGAFPPALCYAAFGGQAVFGLEGQGRQEQMGEITT
jgi:hypothetical protein